MNVKFSIVALSIIVLAIITSGCANQETTDNDAPMSKVPAAEKIEVVHFHGTQQCWSCITVGELALKTIKEKFPAEYQSRVIVYMDINVDLPENADIVNKYKARGASVNVNAIVNGQDNIQEDTNVWRYVSNETQFISYFENKLSALLGS